MTVDSALPIRAETREIVLEYAFQGRTSAGRHFTAVAGQD